MISDESAWLEADWPAPPRVRAGTTLRAGGVSMPPYAGLNLAHHVGDREEAVLQNRAWLRTRLKLPAEPVWLEQVHSTKVVVADGQVTTPRADAGFSHRVGTVCVVMTADCLPVLLTNHQGTTVAAAHAGWRGLNAGILEATLTTSGLEPVETLAWLGPAIGPEVYEVGKEVRQAFLQQPMHDEAAFVPTDPGKYLMDMYCLARQRLHALGVTAIYGGGFCTYRQAEQFYSYRRDGTTGRMASLIWVEPAA